MTTKFRFEFYCERDWPPLAWIAEFMVSDPVIRVRHGPEVETRERWFCEAVWDSDFEAGDFDLTDIVFGSGCRIRDGRVVFVSSGSTVDRLQSFELGGRVLVSNSLACLLAVSEIELDPAYDNYVEFFESICAGLDSYERLLPTPRGRLQLTYFRNLSWDGKTLVEREKVGGDRTFGAFGDYSHFLRQCMKALAGNMAEESRRWPKRMLSTLSSGYDSSAVSVLAAEVGCTQAVSVSTSRGGRRDSGEEVARHLGIDLIYVERDAWRKGAMPEVPFLAGDGKGPDCYLAGARQHLRSRVLLTGFPGDHWRKELTDTSNQIRRGDQAGLSLTEYRLCAGFIHCPVPYLGIRAAADLAKISMSKEMSEWDVPGWSKPICRRLVEEAGVPRAAFGRAKKAASVLMPGTRGFLTESSARDFRIWIWRRRRAWFKRNRIPPIPAFLDLSGRTISAAEWVGKKLVVSTSRAPFIWRLGRHKGLRRMANLREGRSRPYLRRYVFPWAVERMASIYCLSNEHEVEAKSG